MARRQGGSLVHIHTVLPQKLAVRLELFVMDDKQGKPIYGAKKNLIVSLLEQFFAKLDTKEGAQ